MWGGDGLLGPRQPTAMRALSQRPGQALPSAARGVATTAGAAALCDAGADAARDAGGGGRTRFPHALLAEATGGFSAAMRIGGGGSCVVYRASVYGVTVAVKVLTAAGADDGFGADAPIGPPFVSSTYLHKHRNLGTPAAPIA